MTEKERTKFDFGGELESFNPDDWTPKADIAPPAKDISKQVEAVAQASGFKSREVKAPRPQRRRRTGRNVQLNIKVTPETMQAFYDIADQNDWVLGEVLEKAVFLLQKEYGSDRKGK